MGNISDKLNRLIQTKANIKSAIISKGISANDSDTFSSYASKISQIQGQIPSVNINSIEDLKTGWKYKLVNSVSNSSYNSTSEATKSFDDSSWTNITVPHDWSIYNEFNSSSPSGYEGGFLDGGDSWYRRKLTSLTDNSKKVFIYFDGVYKDCDVYINGSKMGSNRWYNPFYFDITSNLNFDGNDVLAVFVRNQQPSSRWYSGSGIIRNAYLVLGNSTFIGINNTVITSNNLETDLVEGIVNTTIKTVINNTSSETIQGKIKYYIKSKGNIINTLEKDINLSIGENTIKSVIKVPNPILWDEYKGNLYSCLIEVYVNNEITFKNEYIYGYRYFSFDKDKGFFLNGRNIKLKGVCMHHDLGCLGAEVNKSAIHRQIKLLKEMGCNAIRITHNPSSTEFLEVCTEEGIMLIEEAFDTWSTHKKSYDFAKDYQDYAESSLKSMVKRSINNPAIIMWSIGNEVNTESVSICQQLVNWVKEIDTTRPVTMGDNQKGRTLFMDLLDVVGLNYASDYNYNTLRSNKPNYKIYGSETTSGLMSRGEYENNSSTQQYTSFDTQRTSWGENHATALKRHMDKDYLAGLFVWTGFDYIGEPTSYNKYPSRSSYFGIIDLAGFPKDIYYMYQSRWTKEPMIHIMPHWNHQTSSDVTVWLYSNCYKVELFINGTSKGSKLQSGIGSKYEFEYNTTYESGIIVANGYDEKDQLIAQDYIYTADSEYKLILKADKSVVNKNNDDLIFVECNVLDKYGILCPEASNKVTFTVENGTVVGTDNGDATDVSSSLRSNSRKAFNGKCLCVVKPDRISDTLIINATSTGLASGTITITQDNYSAIKGKENKDFIDATNPPILDGKEIKLQSISFDENDLSLSLNSPYTLKYTFNPTNTTQRGLIWSVSPSGIATINNGTITGTTEGSCTVTVTSAINSSISATCNITFANTTVSATGVSVNKSEATIKVGESVDLNATLIPSNASNQDVTWSTNNSNVTLTPNGTTVTVMGANEGNSIVTVTTADGGHTATSTITVQAKSSGGDITLPDNYTELKSNYDPAGSSFVNSMEFNPTTQTFYADINIDNSTLSQNILSIGNNIATWNSGGFNIHMYNTSATGLEINTVIGSVFKFTGTIASDGRIKIAWNSDKFYVNGSSIGATSVLTSSAIAKLNATCQYGAAQGNTMSISHYNTIGIINSTKNDEELAQLTAI